MLSFIRDFTPQEKRDYFWEPFKFASTVCRMTFSFRDRNEANFQISYNSIAEDPLHAESLAYNSLETDLFHLLQEHNTSNSSVLDFIIALNNSPCTKCREIILGWIKDLQEITSVRLILFFSNLYKTDLMPEENIVTLFTEWILKLIEIGTVVIISPIIVLQMFSRKHDRQHYSTIAKLDNMCLENFRKLLTEIKSQRSERKKYFGIFLSDNLFEEETSVSLHKFGWYSPKYISVFPNIKSNTPIMLNSQISKLTIRSSSTNSSKSSKRPRRPSATCSNSIAERSKLTRIDS